MKNVELRHLRKATTKPSKTHRYSVEVISLNGFKVRSMKIMDTDMRARTGDHYELFNPETGERQLISRVKHTNLKDKILKRIK